MFDFVLYWDACSDGHEIRHRIPQQENNGSDDDHNLVVVRTKKSASDGYLYRLEDYPVLFRTFAEIANHPSYSESQKRSILGFANQFGLLKNRVFRPFYKEDLSFWISSSAKLASLIRIWEAARAKDIETLRQYVTVIDSPSRYRREGEIIFHPGQMLEDEEYAEMELFGLRRQPKDEIEAAWHIISYAYMELRRSFLLGTLPNPSNIGADFTIFPPNLISCLWGQFYLAVSRNTRIKKCSNPHCEMYFELKAKKRRFEKQYCSDKCRKRVERIRKRK